MTSPPGVRAINGWTRDDAGDLSRDGELETIELLVQTGPDARGGHVAIGLPGMTVGFRAKHRVVEPWDYINPFVPPSEGAILDDAGRAFDRVLRYRASPRTIARLRRSIRLHAGDGYQLGNWGGGRNCATWAQDRLRDVGLVPPPGDCPNQLAWYMDLHSPSPTKPPIEATSFVDRCDPNDEKGEHSHDRRLESHIDGV